MKLTRPIRIFLLYAHQNAKAVHRLYRRLLRTGADLWLDRETLLPGQDWQSEIHKAIYASDLVIVCLSKEFVKQGGFRHEELRIVIEKANSLLAGETFAIPARLEPCDLPELLSRWQCVDLFEAGGYQKLIKSLQVCAAGPSWKGTLQ